MVEVEIEWNLLDSRQTEGIYLPAGVLMERVPVEGELIELGPIKAVVMRVKHRIYEKPSWRQTVGQCRHEAAANIYVVRA